MNKIKRLRNNISLKTAVILAVSAICIFWTIKTFFKLYYFEENLQPHITIEKLCFHVIVKGAILFSVIYLFLWLSRERLGNLGIKKLALKKQILVGASAGIIIFAISNFFLGPFLKSIIPDSTSKGIEVKFLFQNLYHIPLWIFVAMFGGGIIEEFERIFILTRFKLLAGKIGLTFALIVHSVVFGLGHLYQGINGAIEIGFVGLFFGLVYLRKGSAIEAIMAHGVYDLIGIMLAYILYYNNV